MLYSDSQGSPEILKGSEEEIRPDQESLKVVIEQGNSVQSEGLAFLCIDFSVT